MEDELLEIIGQGVEGGTYVLGPVSSNSNVISGEGDSPHHFVGIGQNELFCNYFYLEGS